MIPAYVQTWWGRDAIAPDAVRALARAGCEVRVRRHGPGVNPVRFLLRTLEEMAAAPELLALRVEDDVLAAPELGRALAAWEATRDPLFGLGIGLSDASERGKMFDRSPPAGPIGMLQLYSTPALAAVLPRIRELAEPVAAAIDAGVDALAVDTHIAAAFVQSGRFRVYVHPTKLAEMNLSAVSGWGSRRGLLNDAIA